MNTIQVEEESAIIPLRRLNGWKQQEQEFYGQLCDSNKYYMMSIYNQFKSNEYKVFFLPHDSEVRRALEEYKDQQQSDKKECRDLAAKVNDLEREIDRLRSKKWYEFIPMSK